MINGVHVLIYSKDPTADRAFFRDVLDYPYVEHPKPGDGWLIFKLPPAELGVHPATTGEKHELHFMCDDIRSTVDELKQQGVEITAPIQDAGFGLITAVRLPGGGEIGIYEPKHPVAKDL